MAGYKSHMAFGIITGAFWAGFLFSLSMISIFIAPLILFITVLGSFLPDLDSDSGRPIKVLLNMLSIVSTAYAFFLLRAYSDNFLIIILLAIACYVFTYFIIGKIIKKLTHHRGMFHSIPAVLLCFFFSMYILETTNISDNYMRLFKSLNSRRNKFYSKS